VNGTSVAVTDSLSLPPGRYRVQVSAWGYAELDSTVTIRSGEAASLNGELRPLNLAQFAPREVERLRQAVEHHDLGEYRMVLDAGLLSRFDSVTKAPGVLRVIADPSDIRVDASGRSASFVLLATLDGKPVLPPRNYVASFRQLNSIWFTTSIRNK
jgi:PEGA domain